MFHSTHWIDLAPVSYPGGVFDPTRHRAATACHAFTTVAPVPLASLAAARTIPYRCSNVTRLNDGSLTLRVSSVPSLHRTGLAVLPSARASGLSPCPGKASFGQEAVCLVGSHTPKLLRAHAAIGNLWQYTGSNLTLKRGVIALFEDVRQYVERLHVAPQSDCSLFLVTAFGFILHLCLF